MTGWFPHAKHSGDIELNREHAVRAFRRLRPDPIERDSTGFGHAGLSAIKP